MLPFISQHIRTHARTRTHTRTHPRTHAHITHTHIHLHTRNTKGYVKSDIKYGIGQEKFVQWRKSLLLRKASNGTCQQIVYTPLYHVHPLQFQEWIKGVGVRCTSTPPPFNLSQTHTQTHTHKSKVVIKTTLRLELIVDLI